MPSYEVHIPDGHEAELVAMAESRGTTVPVLIRDVVVQILEEQRSRCISDEFKRLVEESISENEPVLRRFVT